MTQFPSGGTDSPHGGPAPHAPRPRAPRDLRSNYEPLPEGAVLRPRGPAS
jgi:hypothetical protein